MKNISYAKLQKQGGDSVDGQSIFDTMLVRELRAAQANVSEMTYVPHRRAGFPFWVPHVTRLDRSHVVRHTIDPQCRVVSHEALFRHTGKQPIDLAIIHNYFPRFHFPGQRIMNAYYRLGSRQYYSTVFRNSRVLIFLSREDLEAAKEDFPTIAKNSIYLPPPPYPADIADRKMNLIHISGTEDWWPKRESKFTENEINHAMQRGYEITDFGNPVSPAFGFIDERFSVGFKLKLMQMVYAQDVIASTVDMSREIDAFAPGYPFFRVVGSFTEALNYFDSIRSNLQAEALDGAFLNLSPRGDLPTWPDAATRVLDLLSSK